MSDQVSYRFRAALIVLRKSGQYVCLHLSNILDSERAKFPGKECLGDSPAWNHGPPCLANRDEMHYAELSTSPNFLLAQTSGV